MHTSLSRQTLFFFILLFTSSAFAIPVEGQKIMIAGPQPLAVQAGERIARLGGNVIDVAVALELALSVTSPTNATFGGGGFALVKMNGHVDALDFRELAPMKTNVKTFIGLDAHASEDGGLAVGVPGVPAGLWALHQKYGKLRWNQLFTDAIQLAKKGFPLRGNLAAELIENKERFNPAGLKAFFKPDGREYLPGDVIKQKNLVQLLEAVKKRGPSAFYTGPVARDIVDSAQRAGGVVALEDLKNYKVRWLAPLTADFMGYKVYLMPPPSSGGIVISTALKLIEQKNLKARAPLSVDELHLMAEILNMSFRGRSLLGDPDFTTNPIERLLSSDYVNELATAISDKKTTHLPALAPDWGRESKQTTHFSIMDVEGNSVALTITLNGSFGSAVVSDVYGVVLNNEMDDFTTRPGEPNQFGLIQGKANQVEAGKRPLSSMSPTLIEKDGKTILSLGSPGGPRIISAVTQVLYRVLANGYNMDDAIQAPRVHHQYLPQVLYVDPKKLPPETLEALRLRGHKVEESEVALVYGVYRNSKGILEGAFDARGDGAAVGY